MLDKIVELVEGRGWKEGAFESKAGLPQGRISKWKKDGKGKGPSAKEALVMARILEVSLEWLVDDEAGGPAKPMLGLNEDERVILHVYRDLRDEFGLTGEAARRAILRAAGITTSIEKARDDMKKPKTAAPPDYPPEGFEQSEPKPSRGTRRGKASG